MDSRSSGTKRLPEKYWRPSAVYSVLRSGEAGVFGMPEHEILHAEFRCRFAGFTDRAVVLFVGLEAVAVSIEAESFTEEPAAASRVFPASGRTGFVAEAGELFAAVEAQHEAKLLRLGGTDVEEGCPVASERRSSPSPTGTIRMRSPMYCVILAGKVMSATEWTTPASSSWQYSVNVPS